MFKVVIIGDDAEFADTVLKVFAEEWASSSWSGADEINGVSPAAIETLRYGQAPVGGTP
jgi:hypothetical protein